MGLESGFPIARKWPLIEKMAMTLQFPDMTLSSIFFEVLLFALLGLVADPSFMSISSLDL